MQNILFSVENQRFAFELCYVDRVILAVETTLLPHAPPYVMGAINIQGNVTPLISLRQILGMPNREVELNDHFLICHVENKSIAFWIDAVTGVVEYPSEVLIPAKEVLPEMNSVDYVVKENGEIILIYNLKKLLLEAKDDGQNVKA